MQPKYMSLMDSLKEDILREKYRMGERLPSEHALSARYGISRQTVRQALSMLEQQGLIERRQGSGTVVKSSQPLTRQTMTSVAVITTYIGEYIFPEMLGGVEEVLRERGIAPQLAATHNRIDNEKRILTDFASRPIDGIIVEGTKSALPNPNIGLYRSLLERGVRMVFVHSFYPELRQVVHVVADDRGGGSAAVRHLVRKGYRNICGIFKSDDMQGTYRYAGFVEELHRQGLPLNDDHILWFNTENRDMVIRSHIASLVSGCNALVCYNDEVALLVLEYLGVQKMRVPEDIAVVSFDNSRYSELTAVKLTSFANDERAIGRNAATKLLHMLDGNEVESDVLRWTLVEKQST